MLTPPVPPMLASASTVAGAARSRTSEMGRWRVLLFRTAGGVLTCSPAPAKPLAGYFPEITRLARSHLPPGLVLDGELVIW
jgi:hypothetical protein